MAVSGPGRHGVREFSTLLEEREKTYAADLIDVRGLTITKAFDRIHKHIYRIIARLERNTRKRVTEFMIGKSHVYGRKSRNGTAQVFDAMEPSTWTLGGGINQRWSSKYKKRGYNGLVVLTVMPDEDVPNYPSGRRQRNVRENRRATTIAQATKHDAGERYAYDLENRLIDHFEKNDDRCMNETSQRGPSSEGGVAGVVYFAYKLSGRRTVEE